MYANKSGAWGVGGMGESARLVVTLARRLFWICIELLTLNRRWISGITRLASNCERAAHGGELRQAAGVTTPIVIRANSDVCYWGQKRTLLERAAMSANDPEQTLKLLRSPSGRTKLWGCQGSLQSFLDIGRFASLNAMRPRETFSRNTMAPRESRLTM